MLNRLMNSRLRIFLVVGFSVLLSYSVRSHFFTVSLDTWNHEVKKLTNSQNRLIQTPIEKIHRLNPYNQDPWGLGYGVSQFDRYFFLGKIFRSNVGFEFEHKLFLDQLLLALGFGIFAVTARWGATSALVGLSVSIIGNSGSLISYPFHIIGYISAYFLYAGMNLWSKGESILAWLLTCAGIILLGQTKAEIIVFVAVFFLMMSVTLHQRCKTFLLRAYVPIGLAVIALSYEKIRQMFWVVAHSIRSPHAPEEIHSVWQFMAIGIRALFYFPTFLFSFIFLIFLFIGRRKPKLWWLYLVMVPIITQLLAQWLLGGQDFLLGLDFYNKPKLPHFAMLGFFENLGSANFAYLAAMVPVFWLGLIFGLRKSTHPFRLKHDLVLAVLAGFVLFTFLEPNGFRILYWPLNPLDIRWWTSSVVLFLVTSGLVRSMDDFFDREGKYLPKFAVLSLLVLFSVFFFINPLILPFGVFFQPDRQTFLIDLNLGVLAVIGWQELPLGKSWKGSGLKLATAFTIFYFTPIAYLAMKWVPEPEEKYWVARYSILGSEVLKREDTDVSQYRFYFDPLPAVSNSYLMPQRVYYSGDSYNKKTHVENVYAGERWEFNTIVYPHIWKYLKDALLDSGFQSMSQRKEYFKFFEMPVPLHFENLPPHVLQLSGIKWIASRRDSLSEQFPFLESPLTVLYPNLNPAYLYKNRLAKPRAWFGQPMKVPWLVASPERLAQINGALESGSVLVQEMPQLGDFSRDSDKIQIESSEVIEFSAKFAPRSSSRIMATIEDWDESWQAFAGTEKLATVPVFYNYLGVVVPPEVDSVRFTYEGSLKKMIYSELLVMILAILVLLAIFYVLLRERGAELTTSHDEAASSS